MNKEELIKKLDILNDIVKSKDYTKAQQYIMKIKNQLMANEDVAENYIDNLLKELK